MLYLVLGLILVTALAEMTYLAKHKQWGELAVVGVLLLVSLVYNISLILDWNLPTLKDGVEVVFAPVTTFVEGLLK